jgi:hypothetical protein
MRRYSIRALMSFVLVSAVGLAAFRNASDLWAGMMLLVALASVGVSVLGAILMHDRERAWWLGFAVFAGGYLAAAVCPIRSELATTQFLEYLTARALGPDVATIDISRINRNSQKWRIVTSDGGVIAKAISDSVINSTPSSDLVNSMLPPNRWRSTLPGAANHEPFLHVGHCIFTFVAGLLGGMIATWFYTRRQRVEATARAGLAN